ncbi:MAG: glycosyltransferase [Acidobacteriota bacterium]|nr:glycosyltransferase [Acidobacteriota bacterium]
MPAETPAPRARPARVLRIITRLNIGGPSIQALALTTRLAERGYATTLLHGRLGPGEGDMRYLAPDGASLVFVPTLGRAIAPLDDLRTLVALYRHMRQFQPTVIHTHMAKAGLLGRLAARAYNLTRGGAPPARIVHTYHGHVLEGYFSPFMTAVFIAFERLLARLSDTIVAISPAIRDELLTGHRIGRASQYKVIPLGFDLAPFAAVDDLARAAARRALAVTEGVPVVATVGRLTAIKQHRLFLEVIQRVVAAHPKAIALIAGDGELRSELEAYAASLGITGNVRFLGWRRDLAAIYGATDVFLLTSRNEGTPVALIEAMASGVPGVSTDVGGVKDVIDSAEVGLRAPFGDVDRLAAHVNVLIADPARRAAMGARARTRVLRHYSIERLVSDITTVYNELTP